MVNSNQRQGRLEAHCQLSLWVSQSRSVEVGIEALKWRWAGQSQEAQILQQEQGYGFYTSAWNHHFKKLTGSLSAETDEEGDASQACPPSYKVICTGKMWACNLEEGISHHLLQAVESGHFRHQTAGIRDNLHKRRGCMYGWLQA